MRKFLTLLAAAVVMSLSVPAFAEKWQGVDETVVEKAAAEHGRQECPGLFALEGDSKLFAFLVAGISGGFVMGYFMRDFLKRDK
jgi:hypothetical protein